MGRNMSEDVEVKSIITLNKTKSAKPISHKISIKLAKLFSLLLMLVACFMMAKPSYIFTKSVVAQLMLNHAWLQSQQSGEKQLPWQWSDSYPVAKLTDAKSQQSWIVLSGMTGRAMAFAPSWLEDSAKPNEYGNTVISAHNDSHFSGLENTNIGDVFLLEDKKGKILSYRVVTVDIVAEENASPYQFQDETMITLITCYPFEITNKHKSQRLVVQAIKV